VAKKPAASDIGAVSAQAIRDFLHQAAELEAWSAQEIKKSLGLDAAAVKTVLATLQMAGYIEAAGGSQYRNTAAGNAMAKVSAARPITRKTADKAIAQVKERIAEVNVSNEYLYRVRKAVLFGPYVRNAAAIKDVDVAIELEPKLTGSALERAEERQRIEADDGGKRFKSFADRREWPKNKVRAYLKGRSRAVALYDMDEWIQAQLQKPLYEAD
jgi:predicted nucleotidyltransferase